MTPGPVSDSYDPEWSTAANADEIREALDAVYERLSGVLGHREPMHILSLVQSTLPKPIKATLTELEWRLLRFAVERAKESI